MHGVLKRCNGTGIKLTPDKYFVEIEKIRVFGVVFGQDMIQVDLNKVSALKQMSPSTNH